MVTYVTPHKSKLICIFEDFLYFSCVLRQPYVRLIKIYYFSFKFCNNHSTVLHTVVRPSLRPIILAYVHVCIFACICSAQSKNRYNSRIVLRKVGILTLLRNVGILTLRNTILELLLRKVRIGTKWESHFISFIYCTK